MQLNSRPSVLFGPAACLRCEGKGHDSSYRSCQYCEGKGTVLVAQPPTHCGRCSGKGHDSSYRSCTYCDGMGWSHALPKGASLSELDFQGIRSEVEADSGSIVGGINRDDLQGFRHDVKTGLDAIVQWIGGLQNILNGQFANLGFVIYLVGLCLAFGMNMAIKDRGIIGAGLLSLLSWINVGFNLRNI